MRSKRRQLSMYRFGWRYCAATHGKGGRQTYALIRAAGVVGSLTRSDIVDILSGFGDCEYAIEGSEKWIPKGLSLPEELAR